MESCDYFIILQRMNQLTPAIEMKAKKYLNLGYQHTLYYRHANGAFSAFGLMESQSSTWLTAYVARGFRQAMPYVQIDENVIQTALEYLVQVQNDNGGFEERGDVFEQFNDEGISLSAFVTLAFMENVVRTSNSQKFQVFLREFNNFIFLYFRMPIHNTKMS